MNIDWSRMTFALVRAGLPNSIVMLALAAVPIIAMAMTLGSPTHIVRADSPAVTMVAGTTAPMDSGEATAQ